MVNVTVTEALEEWLKELGDERVSAGPVAATALALARELDDTGNSATSKSMCARSLLEALTQLRAMVPQSGEVNPLDDIRARRDRRTAAAAH